MHWKVKVLIALAVMLCGIEFWQQWPAMKQAAQAPPAPSGTAPTCADFSRALQWSVCAYPFPPAARIALNEIRVPGKGATAALRA